MPSLTAPYPPSMNRVWRSGQGRTYTPATVTAYKRQIFHLACSLGLARPGSEPVAVRLILRPIRPKDAEKREKRLGCMWHLGVRCMDIANAEKAALDALQGIAYHDDKQIVRLTLERGLPVDGGALEIHWDWVTWDIWRDSAAGAPHLQPFRAQGLENA